MRLFIPLFILLAVLAVALLLGRAVRGKSPATWWVAAVAGITGVLLMPLANDIMGFDGKCYAYDGADRPCTLAERLVDSFVTGFPYMIAPVILWLALFTHASRP